METMTLWTRQVPEVWEELQASGTYYVKKEYIQKKNGEIVRSGVSYVRKEYIKRKYGCLTESCGRKELRRCLMSLQSRIILR